MKPVLSVVLLFVAYYSLSWATLAVLLLVSPVDVARDRPGRLLLYVALLIPLSALALWAGSRLWRRWRVALGWIALAVGFLVISVAIQRNDAGSVKLIGSQVALILAGVGPLLAPKVRSVTKKGTHEM
jgi:hypothetical protein